MAETHFDDWVARHMARLWPELFEPAVVEATVGFLAGLAGVAGMALRERWADWDRAPFGADSQSHVSVWRKMG